MRQVTKSFLLEVLGRESVCINGKENPIPSSLRNSSLVTYIRKNGINFVLTPKVEEQLKAAGASDELVAIIKRENDKIKEPKLVFINLGIEASNDKNYDEAITNYTEAINIDPDNRTAFHNRGVVYKSLADTLKQQKNYEEANKKYQLAIDDFTQAIRIDQSSVSDYVGRGSCYKDMYTNNDVKEAFAKAQKAIDDFTKAIELDPTYLDAYKNRADTYQYNMGKKDEADADQQKIKEIKNSKNP